MNKDHKNTQWHGLGGPQNSVISSSSLGLICPRLCNSFKLNGLSPPVKGPIISGEAHTYVFLLPFSRLYFVTLCRASAFVQPSNYFFHSTSSTSLFFFFLSQQQVPVHDFSYQNHLTILLYLQLQLPHVPLFIFDMNFLPSFRSKNPLLKVTQSLIDSNTKCIISTHPCLLSSFTLVHLTSRTHDRIGARVSQTFTSCPGKLLTLFSVSTVSPPEVKG